MLNVPQIARISHKDTADGMQRIVNALNRLSANVGVDSTGVIEAPKQIAALSVVGGQGVMNVAISDPAALAEKNQLPITYFVEYSTDPAFINPPPVQVAIGAARNAHFAVPENHWYVRAYSQKFGSNPSTPVVFGSPTAVDCTTGTITENQTPQGSGSAPGTNPGSGYGVNLRG